MAGEQTTNYDSFETSIFEVVFPSMVNQYGTLFGGIALQWMDRAAWICSTRFRPQDDGDDRF